MSERVLTEVPPSPRASRPIYDSLICTRHSYASALFGTGSPGTLAGPKTLQLSNFYFYKEFGEQRVQLKVGYDNNDLEFVGIYVGGSFATNAQGVYAVLPYEIGMSYWPLTSPSFNVRIKGPKDTYFKFALQRSLDAAGGPATVDRDHTGFRFIPRGDKLLDINEVGLKRDSSSSTPEIWFRAGYMRNSTAYTNHLSQVRTQAGNYMA